MTLANLVISSFVNLNSFTKVMVGGHWVGNFLIPVNRLRGCKEVGKYGNVKIYFLLNITECELQLTS